MKLAQKQASLDECPHVSDESKSELEGSAAPPIKLVTIGSGDNKLEIGNETVMFRHDESFYHPPGIGCIVSDDLDDAALSAKIEKIKTLQFVRVGTEIGINVVAVENKSGDAGKFAKAVEAVKALGQPIVLISSDAASMEAALGVCADDKPLIHAATAENCDAFAAMAKDKGCALAVSAPDIDQLAELTAKVKAAGVEDIVLDLSADGISEVLQSLTAVRRLVLKKGVKVLGYPCITVCSSEDQFDNVGQCCSYIAKFSGIVLTTVCEPEHLLPMLTVSQNIYTDPRKPIQVEAKLYEVGAVTQDSPVLVTTNFSLTYYTVEGEVEASRVPAYIAVIDTEGTSVLTAFASDKLTAENVAAFLNSDMLKGKVSHKKVIIPGYITVMSGGLQEESGWEVLVGPREASGISKYLKTVWKA
jgi:acetyl-CoA decarbonylase/synthase complex subunit gamma